MALPKVGILHSGAPANFLRQIEEFKNSLEEEGWDIGEEILAPDPLWADDNPATLKLNAESLTRDNDVKVIVAAGGPASAKAAQTARVSLGISKPIVFTSVVDPGNPNILNIQDLDNPGDITGMAGLTSELDVDRLRFLHELVPSARNIGVLLRPSRVNVAPWFAALSDAARTMGLTLQPEDADDSTNNQQIKDAFARFRNRGSEAVLVTADPLFNNKRKLIVRLAAASGPLPAIYQWREFVAAGGLMSYGPTMKEAYRHAAKYAARFLDVILDGDTAGQLPVVYPSEFELVINRVVARRLRITIPVTMRARAILLTRRRR